MFSRFHHNQLSFEPAFGYLVPIASLASSLPTLVFDIVVTYHTLTGNTFDTSARSIQIPPVAFAIGCLWIVFGPFLGTILCLAQRTHAEQTYGSVHLLGYKIKRLNTIALYMAVLALGLFLLSVLLILFTPAVPD
jgi:hypothetical protein